MRLLIIEDEKDLALPLKKTLEMKGFAVDYAEDGEQGYNTARLNKYDCILLDLNLPKIDGIKLADMLRKKINDTPIIMLTARSQIYDKLEGFESGADDFVTKPFDLSELVARIKAVIKRNSNNKTLRLKFSGYELVPEQNLIIKKEKNKDRKIAISNKETALLEYLLRNKDKIVSTEELLEHVWDREVDLFTDTVKTHIKNLRKKIDPNKEIITTLRGKGYRINI
ncbi:MAG: response regulator transcription factor [Patescibacteria group bacterium]|jgi:DNA-binding response OmpR family regulator